jgi:hypothetical protein
MKPLNYVRNNWIAPQPTIGSNTLWGGGDQGF